MTPRSHIAKPLFDYSPWLAELAAREVESMSHMTDNDVQYWVDRLSFETSEPNYFIRVHTSVSEKAVSDLAMYRRELERREAAKPATLDTVTAKVCADVFASLNRVPVIAADGEVMQAAE